MSPSGEAAAPASAPSTSAAYVPTLFARTSGPAGVVRDLYSIHLCDRHVSPLSFGHDPHARLQAQACRYRWGRRYAGESALAKTSETIDCAA
jgi:hypothetical protein